MQAKKNLGLKQLIKKVGEAKAMAMLEKSEQGFKEEYNLHDGGWELLGARGLPCAMHGNLVN